MRNQKFRKTNNKTSQGTFSKSIKYVRMFKIADISEEYHHVVYDAMLRQELNIRIAGKDFPTATFFLKSVSLISDFIQKSGEVILNQLLEREAQTQLAKTPMETGNVSKQKEIMKVKESSSSTLAKDALDSAISSSLSEVAMLQSERDIRNGVTRRKNRRIVCLCGMERHDVKPIECEAYLLGHDKEGNWKTGEGSLDKLRNKNEGKLAVCVRVARDLASQGKFDLVSVVPQKKQKLM